MHWDFRLELDGVLKSWAVPKAPSLNPTERRLAVQTEDHPFDYASFEGIIPPKQYGAGEVIVWDCGVYSPDEDREYWFHDREEAQRRLREGLAKGKLSIFLRGEKLKGSFALVRSKEAKNWLLIKHKDRFVDEADVTARDHSILSGLSVEDLERLAGARAHRCAASWRPPGARRRCRGKLSPMLACPGERPFTDAHWLFEPKLDGYRVLACIDGKNVDLRSRRGLDLTHPFPSVVAELAEQAVSGMVLDGEIVAIGAGRQAVVQCAAEPRAAQDRAGDRRRQTATRPSCSTVFDLLHFAGMNLRTAPYSARRRWLAQCLLPNRHVRLVDVHEDGEALYAAALAHGFEGVMAKRLDSAYEPGGARFLAEDQGHQAAASS